MAKTRMEKIEDIKNEIAQLENQRKLLVQQQKEQDRKDRTKRLCKRAGLLESLLPETIALTDENFKTFLEKVLLGEPSRRELDGLAAPDTATAPPQTTETVAQGNTHTAANPSATGQTDGTDHHRNNGGNASVTD